MKRAMALLVSAAAVCAVTSARADGADAIPFAAFSEEGEAAKAQAQAATNGQVPAPDPGLFDTLGADGKNWEIQTDATLSTRRVATERLDIGAYWRRTPLYGFVLRISQGMAQDAMSGIYSINGFIPSLGMRFQSMSGHEWIEFGLRVIPPWSSPHDTEPGALRLALDATRTSGQADDTRWLPFDSTGYQAYFALTARLPLWDSPGAWLIGARYGGQTSLTPLTVKTWLGSEQGIVGNTFLDLFLTVPRFADCVANVQVGGHGEVSLSSVWSGNDALPLAANGYIAWSPKTWIQARTFYGLSYLPLAKDTVNMYGVRVAFYVPWP
jgi:hypothetical protein